MIPLTVTLDNTGGVYVGVGADPPHHPDAAATHLKRIQADGLWLRVILAGARSRPMNTAVEAGRLSAGLEVRGSTVAPWFPKLDSIERS